LIDDAPRFFGMLGKESLLPVGNQLRLEQLRERVNDVLPNESRRRRPSEPLFREKWPELLIAVLLVGLAVAVYSLNREVGRIDTKIEDAQPTLQRLDQRIDGIDNRLRDEVNRLQDRIDQQAQQKAPARK
jgi:hypothetical protein